MTVVAADGPYVHPVKVDELHRHRGNLRRHRRTCGPGCVHDLRPVGRSHRLRGRNTGGSPRSSCPSAGAATAADSNDGRHGHGAAAHDISRQMLLLQGRRAADPHAGHNMPKTPPAKPAADPHAGHNMPAQQPPAKPADPHAGHDMSSHSSGVRTHPETKRLVIPWSTCRRRTQRPGWMILASDSGITDDES